MLKHHEEAIAKFKAYFEKEDWVIAIILGGSLAKGLERPDSDVDGMIVVTEEKYQEIKAQNRLSECILGECDYPGGYFDVKYCTLNYLHEVAKNGSEPSRNAYYKAKCLLDRSGKVEDIIPKIWAFPTHLKAEKMFSFYSALELSQGYFWASSKDNIYLRHRAAADTVLFGLRLLLQEGEILFPCQKSLEIAVNRLERKPENILDLAHDVLLKMTDEAKNKFVKTIMDFISYTPPENGNEVLTRYVNDNEQWWNTGSPVIAEW